MKEQFRKAKESFRLFKVERKHTSEEKLGDKMIVWYKILDEFNQDKNMRSLFKDQEAQIGDYATQLKTEINDEYSLLIQNIQDQFCAPDQKL